MEENYYPKIIQEIRDHLKQSDMDGAEELLGEELRMPYIPKTYREELEKLDRDVKVMRKEGIQPKRIEDVDEMIGMLATETGQYAVVASLRQLNLRNYDEVLKKAFATIQDRSLLSVLVELCARQQLRSEYSFTFEGTTYAFIPAALELPEESEGVDECLKLATLWLENDNPSMLRLAYESILRVALLRLPLGVDIDEVLPLTLAIVKNLFLQLADVQEWRAFCEKNTINEGRIESIDELIRY